MATAGLSAADAAAASVPVPDIIKQFVVYLYRHIRWVVLGWMKEAMLFLLLCFNRKKQIVELKR